MATRQVAPPDHGAQPSPAQPSPARRMWMWMHRGGVEFPRRQEVQTAKENLQRRHFLPRFCPCCLALCLQQTICFPASTLLEKLKQAEQRQSTRTVGRSGWVLDTWYWVGCQP